MQMCVHAVGAFERVVVFMAILLCKCSTNNSSDVFFSSVHLAEQVAEHLQVDYITTLSARSQAISLSIEANIL
jgi:hypothetical protein